MIIAELQSSWKERDIRVKWSLIVENLNVECADPTYGNDLWHKYYKEWRTRNVLF